MAGFKTVTSLAVPLIRDNVDTDAIIPSREMTSVSKSGLAGGLFAGWRYQAVGSRVPNPSFVLNDPRYQRAQILLSGANFGCGSSREHAAWALAEYGFRAIIARSFNPIFQGNCVRNGILPIELDAAALAIAPQPLTIDLERQSVRDAAGAVRDFEMDAQAKEMLLDGLDAIDLTMKHGAQIAGFRATSRRRRPWAFLDGADNR